MDLVRTGDRLAFKEIYARHSGRVYAYIWRMVRDNAPAEDLRQEVFIRLWLTRETWNDRGSVAGFLISVARNLTLNAIDAGQTRDRMAISSSARPASVGDAPDVVLEKNNLQKRVDDAVESLPARAREVFVLKHDAGLSYNEIADLLGIASKTVEAHMGRAYALLREALADLRD